MDVRRGANFALVVTELATNSIKHANSSGEIRIVRDDERAVYAEVSDHGPGIDTARPSTPPAPDAVKGRGLWLSDQLSDHMHITTGPDGTTIRVEIDLPNSGPPAPSASG
jgi:anti-sigma regulatory factor (Ser/Thr protein kinase)